MDRWLAPWTDGWLHGWRDGGRLRNKWMEECDESGGMHVSVLSPRAESESPTQAPMQASAPRSQR